MHFCLIAQATEQVGRARLFAGMQVANHHFLLAPGSPRFKAHEAHNGQSIRTPDGYSEQGLARGRRLTRRLSRRRQSWVPQKCKEAGGRFIFCRKQKISRSKLCIACSDLARQEGLEPPTFWFVAKHSIRLSYWRS